MKSIKDLSNMELYTSKQSFIKRALTRCEIFKVEGKELIMKNLKSILKSIILTGVIAILTLIPIQSDKAQDTNNYNIEIQSINYIDNSITIQKDNNLYTFYVDDPETIIG